MADAAHCSMDTLTCVFNYLSLDEFRAAAFSCRQWLTAASQPRMWHDAGSSDSDLEPQWIIVKNADALLRLCASPLRHRCFALHLHDLDPPPDWTQLQLIRNSLPRLRALALNVG